MFYTVSLSYNVVCSFSD